MRKLIFCSAILFPCVFTSCNSGSGGLSATAKKNLEVNTAIMKAYEAGDFSKVSDYIAADAIDHAGENGDINGLENIIKEMRRYRDMMTDSKTEVKREMADDEYVMTWGKFSGTLKTDGMGKKAGEKIEMTSVDVSRFKDGKAVEHWSFADPNEMMKMMMGNTTQMPTHGDTNTVRPPKPLPDPK